MRMVTIEKDSRVLTVTQGAFRMLYAPLGYVVVGAQGPSQAPLLNKQVINHTANENAHTDDSKTRESYSDTTEDKIQAEPEIDFNEIPLSEMDFATLKAYARKLGIRANGMGSKKDLRNAIRAKLGM